MLFRSPPNRPPPPPTPPHPILPCVLCDGAATTSTSCTQRAAQHLLFRAHAACCTTPGVPRVLYARCPSRVVRGASGGRRYELYGALEDNFHLNFFAGVTPSYHEMLKKTCSSALSLHVARACGMCESACPVVADDATPVSGRGGRRHRRRVLQIARHGMHSWCRPV